jgi:hypothetical protein
MSVASLPPALEQSSGEPPEESLNGAFGDRLKVSVPFDIDIDFGTLDDFR